MSKNAFFHLHLVQNWASYLELADLGMWIHAIITSGVYCNALCMALPTLKENLESPNATEHLNLVILGRNEACMLQHSAVVYLWSPVSSSVQGPGFCLVVSNPNTNQEQPCLTSEI